MTQDDERKRGVLSPADRRYLRDPESYSRQSSYERRYSIRQRLRDSVLDFSLLFESLPPSERQAAFGVSTGFVSPEEDVVELDEEELQAGEEGVRDGVGFLFQVARDLGGSGRRAVEDGVQRGEEATGPHTAEVSLDVETYQTARLANRARERLEGGEELTDGQVRAALERGTVDPERLAAHLRNEDGD